MHANEFEKKLNAYLLPDICDGLTEIQGDLFVAKYMHPESHINFKSLAKTYDLPLGVICYQFYRLIQQLAPLPLFEDLANYSWLKEFPTEDSEIIKQREFEDFLQSIRFPDLTQYGLDIFQDVRLTLEDEDSGYIPAPLPVRLPLHMVSAISFSFDSEPKINFPPHNLAETIDAIFAKLEDPGINSKELLKIIRGPDFACGGIIKMSVQGLKSIYQTGNGFFEFQCDATESCQVHNLSFSVPDVDSAYHSLSVALKSNGISGVTNVLRQEKDLTIAFSEEQDALTLKSKILSLPSFTINASVHMKVVSGTIAKQINLETLLQEFIKYRVNYLSKIHGRSEQYIIESFKEDLLELKDKYGRPRRTQIVLA